MFAALMSFLGGSVFRMIWGELSSWLTASQSHAQEIERMKLQAELDEAQHRRNQEAIKLQAELGVKVIAAQAESVVGEIEAQGWLEAVKATGRSIGIAWVDAWNAAIRPGLATWGVVMLSGEAMKLLVVTEATATVIFAAIGIFVADRSLGKRGK